MTETDAASAVQMFVYALGSAPLLADAEKVRIFSESFLIRILW